MSAGRCHSNNIVATNRKINRRKTTPRKRKTQPKNVRSRLIAETSSQTARDYLAMVTRPRLARTLQCYPDGSQEPSFAYRFKQVFTMTPCGDGTLSFAMFPGILGGIAINGQVGVSAETLQYSSAGALTTNATPVNILFPNGSSLGNEYVVFPFREQIASIGGRASSSKAFLAFAPSKFRVLAQEMNVRFTGNTLYDGGSVVVARANICPEITNVAPPTLNSFTLQGYNVLPPPTSQSSVAQGAASQLFDARTAITARNVNTVCSYHSVNDYNLYMNATGGSNVAFSGNAYSSTSSRSRMGVFAVDPNMPLTYFVYGGLTSGASITVEVTSIIEMAINPTSSVAGLARPNPPRQRQLDSALERIFAYLPPAEQILDSALSAAIPFASRLFSSTTRSITNY